MIRYKRKRVSGVIECVALHHLHLVYFNAFYAVTFLQLISGISSFMVVKEHEISFKDIQHVQYRKKMMTMMSS